MIGILVFHREDKIRYEVFDEAGNQVAINTANF